MQLSGRVSRAALLVLTTLSACAAMDGGWGDDRIGTSKGSGAFGAFLAGRFAIQESDYQTAADQLAKASRDADDDAGAGREVSAQAFIAALLAGRSDAAQLAARLPANPVAQLVLADEDAKAGRWADAEARFAGLPQEGVTQVLRPLLVAWAQAGARRTPAALATLQPLLDTPRLRGIAALHAALIADLGQSPDADRLYTLAKAEFGGTNLRLALALASWQARQGNVAEAQRTIDATTAGTGELALARTALEATVNKRVIAGATDGIAEVYLAVGASVQQQTQAETAQVLLQLAIAMRPDLTAARLLTSDMLALAKRYRPALAALASVGADDPLAAPVQLRRATLQDQLGESDDAVRTLDRLAAAFPARPEPLAQEGDIFRTKSRFPEAVAAYDRAIARIGTPNRANWPLFYARGIAHERVGTWPKAESDFLYALQLAPDQPSVLNYLGYAWTERDQNLPRARDMIQRAVELRPEEGAYIDSLGWIQLRQGDGPAAVKSLERAVELEADDPVVNGHLGDALAAVGRLREAEFQWRRALTLKPEPPEARRIEAKLAALPMTSPPATPRR